MPKGEKYFSFIYFFPKGTIAGAVETIQSSTAVRSFIGGGFRTPASERKAVVHEQTID